MCGASRAFARASRGDRQYREYNAIWVYAAGVALLLGVASFFGVGPRAIRQPLPERHTVLVGVSPVFLLGWLRAVKSAL